MKRISKRANKETSSFIVGKDGKLYHRALMGLELNVIYVTLLDEYCFGHGE